MSLCTVGVCAPSQIEKFTEIKSLENVRAEFESLIAKAQRMCDPLVVRAAGTRGH